MPNYVTHIIHPEINSEIKRISVRVNLHTVFTCKMSDNPRRHFLNIVEEGLTSESSGLCFQQYNSNFTSVVKFVCFVAQQHKRIMQMLNIYQIESDLTKPFWATLLFGSPPPPKNVFIKLIEFK